ncbi:D-glycero-beta-D-manno-heptose 1-phosphate adenylyltransferase [Mucisphaera calidilacus]|uniref:Bifunctional protein HldE n=1 Tax=Mucisphaera calidilacus TaxID=2527982 RepID=A0A518BTD0_9BACT|nr:D-glycero-beta-D-manno-heptose 1-phosphate adenylyltransferase [Mucisphaera calidilacus]QDU70230.1 Bifunctional protein HldE [Mucisphaera calidilacus]
MKQDADLLDRLDRWRSVRVVVVGDFMLDRYTYGNAERLSPDAPVPVLAVEREEVRPGGASNVCRQLAAMRCDVRALGVIGEDEAGGALVSALAAAGVDGSGLTRSVERPTTVKHSLVGLAQHRHPQKMFRLDTEVKSAIDGGTAERLLESVAASLGEASVLCLEDYNKGVLTEDVCRRVIAMCRERGVPVFVDPAAISDYGKYRGATTITPNRTEAEKATGLSTRGGGDEALAEVARRLRSELDLESVVLTLDKQGALLMVGEERPELVPTVARSVYDVTGAGDTVLAMLSAARGNGCSWRESVALANLAAGLEVERFGVVPIDLEEVMLSALEQRHASLGKARTLETLLPELGAHRRVGKRVAMTNGCFDVLHAGHVAYLREARKAGDLLVVAVNDDASITRLKGEGRPVNGEADRVLVLSELESVDYVVVFDRDTPTHLIEAIRPEVLVKGADYTRDQVVGHEVVDGYGGEIVLVGLREGLSTTNILRKLEDGKG